MKNGGSQDKILTDADEEEMKPPTPKSEMESMTTATEDPQREEHARTEADGDSRDQKDDTEETPDKAQLMQDSETKEKLEENHGGLKHGEAEDNL